MAPTLQPVSRLITDSGLTHCLWQETSTPPAASDAARHNGVPRLPGFVVPAHLRVRRDKVDITGTITLRHNSRLHHIGLGRRLIGTRVLVLVADLDVRVLSEDGELIRRLTLDPTRDYQPHGRS